MARQDSTLFIAVTMFPVPAPRLAHHGHNKQEHWTGAHWETSCRGLTFAKSFPRLGSQRKGTGLVCVVGRAFTGWSALLLQEGWPQQGLGARLAIQHQ